MVFTIFDRDALRNVKESTDVARQGFNDSASITGKGINIPGDAMSAQSNREAWMNWKRPHYSDEIPPLTLYA